MPDLLLQPLPQGLYCPAGDFFIDPPQPVARAVITHAHGDHARQGNAHYHVAAPGLALMRERLGEPASIQAHAFGEAFALGPVRVSLHPSGHMLGAAQIRLEHAGQVVVVSGDYKREPDPTCRPFEPVPCDVFVTESTFGLPVYRWPPIAGVIDQLLAWWDDCARRAVPAVLFCYALGKAQRVLAELGLRCNRQAWLHGALLRPVELYREAGVSMLPTRALEEDTRGSALGGELVLAPPSAAASRWMRRFPTASTGFVSGWMQVRGNRRRRGYDRGFVVSDHADWPSLLRTVADSRARRVYVTHGEGDALIRYLRESGHDARPLASPGGGPLMRRFADLFAALDRTGSTAAKRDAIAAYLHDAPPGDAAWAIYALGGGKLRRLATTTELREAVQQVTGYPEWLVSESHQHVGDLAEAIALLLPPGDARLADTPLQLWMEQWLPALRALDAGRANRPVAVVVAGAAGGAGIPAQQAADRRVAGGRVATAGGAGAGAVVATAHRPDRPSPERRLAAASRCTGGTGPGPGGKRAPGRSSLSVLPGLAAGAAGGCTGSARGLAGGVEMGRDPRTADAPHWQRRPVVPWRGTAGRPLPGSRTGRRHGCPMAA